MADFQARSLMQVTIAMEITEPEARALDALVGYGDDAFIKTFYEKLGEAYMKPHENALRKFFQSVRDSIPGILYRADRARAAFHDKDYKPTPLMMKAAKNG